MKSRPIIQQGLSWRAIFHIVICICLVSCSQHKKPLSPEGKWNYSASEFSFNGEVVQRKEEEFDGLSLEFKADGNFIVSGLSQVSGGKYNYRESEKIIFLASSEAQQNDTLFVRQLTADILKVEPRRYKAVFCFVKDL